MNQTQRYGLSSLDPQAGMPLYQQIYLRLRNAITDGLISPGQRIPAARALAKELGLARGTIESAYSLLASEGYVQARGQAGTVVMPGLEHIGGTPLPVEPASASIPALPQTQPVAPFQMGLPALDAFPRKIWHVWLPVVRAVLRSRICLSAPCRRDDIARGHCRIFTGVAWH
nr:GntR family transcriptional regulator [Advenella kashmirensis]